MLDDQSQDDLPVSGRLKLEEFVCHLGFTTKRVPIVFFSILKKVQRRLHYIELELQKDLSQEALCRLTQSPAGREDHDLSVWWELITKSVNSACVDYLKRENGDRDLPKRYILLTAGLLRFEINQAEAVQVLHKYCHEYPDPISSRLGDVPKITRVIEEAVQVVYEGQVSGDIKANAKMEAARAYLVSQRILISDKATWRQLPSVRPSRTKVLPVDPLCRRVVAFWSGKMSRHLAMETEGHASLRHFIKAETIELIREELGELDCELRKVVALQLAGWKLKEIAERLGLSIGEIWDRSARAREELRTRLK